MDIGMSQVNKQICVDLFLLVCILACQFIISIIHCKNKNHTPEDIF